MNQVAIKPAYLDLPAVCNFVALSNVTIYKLVREDAFPRPRQLSGRRVAWLVRELEAWAESCPVSNLACPPNTGGQRTKLKAV